MAKQYVNSAEPLLLIYGHVETYTLQSFHYAVNFLSFLFSIFFFGGRGHEFFLWGSMIPLFWTSGDVCPGFQSQDGSLA